MQYGREAFVAITAPLINETSTTHAQLVHALLPLMHDESLCVIDSAFVILHSHLIRSIQP